MREGCERAGMTLLEPIMDVEVVTARKLDDRVARDINGRRSRFRERGMRGNDVVIRADVPMACLVGYSSALRLLTSGRATCTTRFSHYAEAPRNDLPDFSPAVGMRVELHR